MRNMIIVSILLCCTFVQAKPSPETQLAVYQELAAEGLLTNDELSNHRFRLQKDISATQRATRGGTSVISGTVTESATPLDNVYVALYSSNWEYIDSVYTNVAGFYEFTALDDGDYIVTTDHTGDDYIDAIWTSTGTEFCQRCQLPANSVINLGVGVISSNHDLTLTIGATLTGLLVDSNTGLEVDSLYVNLYHPNGLYNWYFSTQLDGMGQYTIKGIPAGQYIVYLTPDYIIGNNHIPEIYNNIQCNLCSSLAYDGMGDLVNMVNGATRSGVDFSLQTGASISGQVVNNIGLSALDDYALVYLFNVSNQVISSILVEGTNINPGATGTYSIGGLLPGTYFAQGGDWGQSFFVRQIYNNMNCPWSGCDRGAGGTPINLGPNEQRLGINFLLQYGGKISGNITDASTSLPINNDEQWVQFYDNTGAVVGGAYADPVTGDYISARAIPAGTYSVRTGSMFHGRFTPGYVMEKYDSSGNIDCPGVTCDLTAVNVVVNTYNPASGPDPAADATTSGIDFVLDSGYSFSGTIRDLTTLLPLPDVHVLVYDNMGNFAHWATTDINGDFTVSGLPAGTYYAKTNNGSNLPFMGLNQTAAGSWVDILYDDLPCPGSACDVTTGTPIVLGPLPPGMESKGDSLFNFELPDGGTLSGRLINSETTAGVTNTLVKIYNSSGEFNGAFETDDEGYWQSSGLPTGNYYLVTEGIGGMVDVKFGGGYCFDGLCDPLTATPINLGGNYNISGLNMILKPDYVFKAGME